LRRVSAESGGILMRMNLPSFCGLKPSPLEMIAFSMSFIVLASNGRMTI